MASMYSIVCPDMWSSMDIDLYRAVRELASRGDWDSLDTVIQRANPGQVDKLVSSDMTAFTQILHLHIQQRRYTDALRLFTVSKPYTNKSIISL